MGVLIFDQNVDCGYSLSFRAVPQVPKTPASILWDFYPKLGRHDIQKNTQLNQQDIYGLFDTNHFSGAGATSNQMVSQ